MRGSTDNVAGRCTPERPAAREATRRTPKRAEWDDDEAIRRACEAGASEREVLLTLGYAPESSSARAKLAVRADELGLTVPQKRSPFADLDEVRTALAHHRRAIDVLRMLGASTARKNYDRLDTLARDLGFPAPERQAPRNSPDGMRHVRNSRERQALTDADGELLRELIEAPARERDVLAHFGLPDTAQNRRRLHEVLDRRGLTMGGPLRRSRQAPARRVPVRSPSAL